VFENKVLRRILGQKGIELIGGWRNLHNEELRNLCPSAGIIRMTNSRRIRWTLTYSAHWAKRNAYRLVLVKPGGRSRHMEEDYIKMDLTDIG
jgi:hypothetical protein